MKIEYQKGKLIEFELDIQVRREGEAYIAYIPVLDLSTHGDSEPDVLKAASESARIFLEEIVKMGTADQVLIDLGWKKEMAANPEFPYIPPPH